MVDEYKNIRAIFDDKCSHLKIDKNLIRRLEEFKIKFISMNEQHMQFFGSNLIGNTVVRFLPMHRDRIFHDILRIDEKDVDKFCNNKIPKKYYVVAGDNANLALAWLCHAIRRSDLPEKDKINGQALCIEIMQYKFLTSRMWKHWRYPCSTAESEALLAALSNKYLIKQKGSWNRYLRDRALQVIDPETSNHKDTLMKMERDIATKGNGGQTVAYLITDVQSGIRDMLKNLFDVFLTIHSEGKKINAQSKISVFDGDKALRDDFNQKEKLKRYIHSIIPDKNSYMKPELMDIIVRALKTMPIHYFTKTLEWISKNYGNTDTKTDVANVIDNILEHALTYLSNNNEFLRNQHDISFLLSRMKGIYSSSRSTDALLIQVRKEVEELVTLATGSRSPAVVAATRNGVLLYTLLRTFTMSYYSN